MLKRTAIAIDDAVYRDLAEVPRERGTTRNRLIGNLLKMAVKAREWRPRNGNAASRRIAVW